MLPTCQRNKIKSACPKCSTRNPCRALPQSSLSIWALTLLRYLARQGEHEVLMISVDSHRKATYIPASGFTCGLLLGPQRISADGKDQEGTLIILGFSILEVQAVQKVRKPRRSQLCGLAVVVKCHHSCSETRCEEPQCSETTPGSGTAQTRSNPQKKVIRLPICQWGTRDVLYKAMLLPMLPGGMEPAAASPAARDKGKVEGKCTSSI